MREGLLRIINEEGWCLDLRLMALKKLIKLDLTILTK